MSAELFTKWLAIAFVAIAALFASGLLLCKWVDREYYKKHAGTLRDCVMLPHALWTLACDAWHWAKVIPILAFVAVCTYIHYFQCWKQGKEAEGIYVEPLPPR